MTEDKKDPAETPVVLSQAPAMVLSGVKPVVDKPKTVIPPAPEGKK